MAEINLSVLFEQEFGVQPLVFDPKFNPVPSKDSINPAVPQRKEFGKAASSPFYAPDANGREYYMPVTFSYENDDSGVIEAWRLPYPVVSIRSQKKIIVTELTERSGTVKQLVSRNDYEILIRGFFINKTNEMPEDDIMKMRRLYEHQVPISMACALTDIFLIRPDRSGSDRVVITSLNMPEIRGVKNIRGYEITLLSDEPFSIEDIG